MTLMGSTFRLRSKFQSF